MQWFRVWHGFLQSPKWTIVSNRVGCPKQDVIAVAMYLMDIASKDSDRGSIATFDPDECEVVTGVTRDICDRVVTEIKSLSRAPIDADRWKNWDEYQPKDSTATERKRRQREREKQQKQALNDCDERDVTETGDGVTRDVTTITEQNRTESKRKNTKKEKPDPPLFGEFWSAYPRKVAKPQARSAFEKATAKAEPADIVAGAKAYAQQVSGKEPEFIAHPSTWLNGDRWNDEPPPQPKAQANEIIWGGLR